MADEADDEAAIIDAARALEAADEPLRPRDWPALVDANLRERVARRLSGMGRQLLPILDGTGTAVIGYLSTWSDDAAFDLARAARGLQEIDLALLTLLYLHWEVLGRVLGEDLRLVHEQLNAYVGTGRDAIRGDDRKESLARLQAHQLIRADYRLGPAFDRLTPIQRTRLDQSLFLLLRPDHAWAAEIRQSRQTDHQEGL
jgi:hypothetical protein